MKRFFTAIIFTSLVLAVQAYGEAVSLKPQRQGGVSFVSGGVGEHEQKAMRAVQGDYNLHLMFAVKGSGEYVTGAKVKIENAKGHTLLDTVSSGPSLYAKLTPGAYIVTADRDGHVLKEKVTVGPKHGTSVVFDFPVEKGD